MSEPSWVPPNASPPTDSPDGDEQPSAARWQRLIPLFLSFVIAVAVIGFFVGIGAGVPRPEDSVIGDPDPGMSVADVVEEKGLPPEELTPALSYREMSSYAASRRPSRSVTLESLPRPGNDLFAEVEPSEADKERSSAIRASRRAFNGAPPVIPHATEGTNDAACYQCHSQGITIGALRASLVSHDFLANCTQCHAPPPPRPFEHVSHEVESTFVGLAAPKAGQRAYPGAPPTIPHSRFMRENCTSCHGNLSGWPGMQSTHPWRTNCTQCHAPSAVLDQAVTSHAADR